MQNAKCKKIVSLLICLTLAISVVFPCTVSASTKTYYLELTEGEKIWLNAQNDLFGVDTPSWSMSWKSNSNDIIILQKTYDLRQCLVQAVSRTADIYYVVELTYKTLLSSGFYQTNWVTFKIKIKCSHNFTGGTVITPPTAGTEGVMKGYCSKCNEEMTKKIPALGYKDFTGLEFSDASFDYDGTEKSISINTVPDGATVTYSSDTAKQNKATNAGDYKIKATVSHPDYNDWVKEATLKINKKALTIEGLSAKDKIYDGTDKATLSGGTLNGVISADDVSANIPTEGKFADKNVNDNKSVTINTIKLSGAKKDNYTLAQPTGLKANITKKEISVTADNQIMIKNGTMPALTYSYAPDALCDGDGFTGKLTTKADGKSDGTFEIEQGTLSAGGNYKINFTNGTLKVSDKFSQTATVSAIPEKTYGDKGFKVEVTNDKNTDLGKFKFESSNTNVATIDESGNVTIKNAGETNIIVKRSGNDTYADFEKTQKLTVKKVAITVTADAMSKRVGTDDPALTYRYTGNLVGSDNFTGKLERVAGEEINKKYDILQGTLKINDNYNIIYNKATFEILDKNPQNITVADFGDKTYGDKAFKVTVTPDATSNLSNFTYVSDNENVATISADGTITIVGAGEADITVTEAGNADYAQATVTKKLTVAKKAITLKSIDVENKTAVLEGILASDESDVTLDFDKINVKLGDAVDETTSNAVLTNFVLKGDKAGNYNITAESLNTTITNENVVTVTITAENGTATGATKYLKGAEVTVVATPNDGYKFYGWYNGDTSVSTNATYTFTAESDISLVAKFTKKSGGGGSSVSTYTIKFETNGGSKVTSVKVNKNKTVAEPTAPTKDGFEFAGWYTDKTLTTKYDFDTKITKGITLYAAWTEKKIEVKDDNTEPTTPENKITFTDVKENDWFAENVKYVVENGLMNGTTETEFEPNDNLTRAMLVTILYRAAGEPETNKSIPFADVTADSYYANAVIWAHRNGIVSGVNENEFAPDENITREQIATIIYRYANYKGYDTSAKADISAYADADEISEYATEAMQYAVASGLIKGKTETTLNPQDNATRAEIAAILQRFIEANK